MCIIGSRKDFIVERVLHYHRIQNMINSTHRSCKGAGITVEKVPHSVDALVVIFVFDNREGLVQKLRSNCFNREIHHFYVKVSGFYALG